MTASANVSRPTNILVPVDLSERSERALAYAGMLAEATAAELIVMVNINMPEREVLEELTISEGLSLDEAAEHTLRQLVSRLAPEASATLVDTRADSPADAILAMAHQHDADMIVIGSHGRGGMRRFLLGSVAEKVARTSELPVVIVPSHDEVRHR